MLDTSAAAQAWRRRISAAPARRALRRRCDCDKAQAWLAAWWAFPHAYSQVRWARAQSGKAQDLLSVAAQPALEHFQQRRTNKVIIASPSRGTRI